jgi:nucleolar protein 56
LFGVEYLKSTIAVTLLGIFALDDEGRIVEKELFPTDPREAAERLSRLQRGEIVDELSRLLETLSQRGYSEFHFEERGLALSVEKSLRLTAKVTEKTKAITNLRSELGELAVRLGRLKNHQSFREYTHLVTVSMAEEAVSRETQRKDLHAIQIIRTLDDIDKTLNLFFGRIREWYGLHFPELDNLVDKHETYTRLVSDLAVRENFTPERLESEGLPQDKARVISEKAKRSIGFAANMPDLELLQTLSKQTLELHRCRSMAEEHLNALMEEVAPNMTSILGPLLSARLISIAGSLDRIAKMPSSTVQVLGAEKALFRSLKTGTRPPKHGIIFQYQPIHAAPKWHRGKIARTLSSKLSIAARMDAFGGEFIGDKLKMQLEKRIAEIQKAYPSPPSVRSRK